MSRAEPKAGGGADLRDLRRDPTVRTVALAWRRLTGGKRRRGDVCRRTLIACSGGADSSGLAIALAAAVAEPRGLFVLGHVVHDLRPEAEALADRDAARELARRLDVPFAERRVSVRREPGNAEATARRLRYVALAEMADVDACGFVATAHHADDQLETVLMGLLRGAGPGGLRGVRPRRRISEDAVLIRPALEIGRADLARLCSAIAWTWREDRTNEDVSRTRAALRHRVLPLLKELRPRVAERAQRTARLSGEAADLVRARARELITAGAGTDGMLELARARLRKEPGIVVGAWLREAALTVRGAAGQDRLGGSTIEPIVQAISDDRTEPRTFRRGGIEVTVTARFVSVRRYV